MPNLGSRLAWLKKKELGLPLGVWAAILAVVILWAYRRHKAATAGTSSASSTNPNGVDALGNAPTSGGASDQSGALEAIANEVAMETQLLSNVLDKLQGKKKKAKPHKKKHHPKKHKAPTTHKTPVAHHPKHKKRRVKPRHRRSSIASAFRASTVKRPNTAGTFTATSKTVTPGGLRKPVTGGIPKLPSEPLAHPPGELDRNREHIPETIAPSFTRGPATVAKRTPLATHTQPREVEHRHPSTTKARKH
jgi:hypothetical protein